MLSRIVDLWDPSTPFAPAWITHSGHTHIRVVMCDSLLDTTRMDYITLERIAFQSKMPLLPRISGWLSISSQHSPSSIESFLLDHLT